MIYMNIFLKINYSLGNEAGKNYELNSNFFLSILVITINFQSKNSPLCNFGIFFPVIMHIIYLNCAIKFSFMA